MVPSESVTWHRRRISFFIFMTFWRGQLQIVAHFWFVYAPEIVFKLYLLYVDVFILRGGKFWPFFFYFYRNFHVIRHLIGLQTQKSERIDIVPASKMATALFCMHIYVYSVRCCMSAHLSYVSDRICRWWAIIGLTNDGENKSAVKILYDNWKWHEFVIPRKYHACA